VTEDGFTAFGRRFSNRVSDWKEELLTLEREGAVYEQWILDEADGGPGLYRIRLQPAEIYGYVAAIVGWDEYLAAGFDAVADRQLASRAAASARERPTYDDRADGPCPADFFGEHLEALVCGSHSERAERLHPNISPGDASVMLHEIASGLPTAVKALTDRGATQSSFAIQQERDVQDLLFVILRSLFPDARREEWAPSHAGSSKRIDLVIPSGRTVVEVKFVRDRSHGRRVADELKIDIESYHGGHPACGTLFVLVWDENRHLADPQQLERDLTGPRSKGGARFDVAVRVV
jgi:hypothetical protein